MNIKERYNKYISERKNIFYSPYVPVMTQYGELSKTDLTKIKTRYNMSWDVSSVKEYQNA